MSNPKNQNEIAAEERRESAINVEEVFAALENEYCEFDKVEDQPHQCRYISAFLILHDLGVVNGPLTIAGTEFDFIYLQVDMEKLAYTATEDDIRKLVRCGVSIEERTLVMVA